MLIMCDVDATLYDSDKTFAKAAERYGVTWPDNNYHWMQPEYLNTDLKTLLNIFKTAHGREFALDNEPYPDAVEVLSTIAKNYDVQIDYVSNRNEQQETALEDWLEQKGFLSEKTEQIIATKDKREWMKKYLPNIVIDDRVQTILMARYEIDADVIALKQRHNMNLEGEAEGIYICNNWKEIGKKLEELITGE